MADANADAKTDEKSDAMRASKKPFWIIVTALVVPAIAMSWIAWSVTRGIRDDARVTDARLRELAWSVLAYADEFAAFPTSEAQLRAFAEQPGGVPEALAAASTAPGTNVAPDYPTSRALAAIAPPPPTLDESLLSIEVEWGLASDVQPILRSKGKPTLQGTAPTVGQWLYAMSTKIRAH